MLTPIIFDLRSSGDLNACYSVTETVGPQTGDVLITNLHLTALKVCTLVQADLMILGILYGNTVETVWVYADGRHVSSLKKNAVFLMHEFQKLSL